MDNKLAIDLLSMIEFEHAECCLNTWYKGIDDDMKEALEMAIKALSYSEKPNRCGDAINRDAAIRLAEQGQVQGFEWQFKQLVVLPSVSTEKTGRWIRWYEVIESADGKSTDHIPHCKCSECGTEYDSHSSQFIKYCNACGAKMQEVEE